MSNEICEDALKLKQTIIDEGLYEEGMSVDDMQQLYKTLTRSKRTATDENEYRELLSQTNLNCTQMELMNSETEVGGEDINNKSVISVKENISTICKNKQTKLVDKYTNIDENTDINFSFNTNDNYKPMSIRPNKNVVPILYHHPAFLKLPTEKKSEMILLYLQHQQKQIKVKQDEPPVPWCKPISSHPDSTFDNTHVDQESELSQISDCNSVTETNKSPSQEFGIRRSTRIGKRKIYKQNSDDDLPLSNKKTKCNSPDSNAVNKNDEQQNLIEFTPSTSKNSCSQKVDSDEEFIPILNKRSKLHDDTVVVNKSTSASNETVTGKTKWFSKEIDVKQKFANAIIAPDVSDRINKLFDKLRDEENKNKPKENTVNLNDITDFSDSADDIYPVSKTVVSVHTEVKTKLKKGKAVAKKTHSNTRKKFYVKNTNEEKQENNTTEIPWINFYGKNIENKLDASNNNNSTTSKLIQCPICSQSFQDSEIEDHAARCEQFDDSQAESKCVICNKFVLNVDMDAHKFQCLEQITEEAVNKPYEPNTSNLGFLCSVCEKYVVDGNQMDHANNCIAFSK